MQRLCDFPYVKGFSENVMKAYDISVSVRPQYTLRKAESHPKDKVQKESTCGVVYEIPCHNCEQVAQEVNDRPLQATMTCFCHIG